MMTMFGQTVSVVSTKTLFSGYFIVLSSGLVSTTQAFLLQKQYHQQQQPLMIQVRQYYHQQNRQQQRSHSSSSSFHNQISNIQDKPQTTTPTTTTTTSAIDGDNTAFVEVPPPTIISLYNSSFAECWNSTSWTVTNINNSNLGYSCRDHSSSSFSPSDDDDDGCRRMIMMQEILPCFNSPAPHVYYAFISAMKLSTNTKDVLQIFSYMLKTPFEFQILKQQQQQEEETQFSSIVEVGQHHHQQWRIVDTTERQQLEHDDNDSEWEPIEPHSVFPNTLSIAQYMLDRAIDRNQLGNTDNEDHHDDDIEYLEELAVHRLRLTLGVDIRGRSSADAAFAFAMAGISSSSLYEMLAYISYHELNRIGRRPSFPSQYILQIVEKLAAAGVVSGGEKVLGFESSNDVNIASEVYKLAADLLLQKKDSEEHSETIQSLQAVDEDDNHDGNDRFGLHSARPLLWLWRFAARQSKVRTVPLEGISYQTSTNTDWASNFHNQSLPLVVDLGCGFGVSLLGLSTLQNEGTYNILPLEINSSGDSCNYIGVDLSGLSIGYAQGIAKRWGIDHRLQFTCKSATQLLKDIAVSYPKDKVALIMIQFPTPFKLTKGEGNDELPPDEDTGFMVNKELLEQAASLIQHCGGYILLQSNCEDIAVKMRQIATEELLTRLECVDIEPTVSSLLNVDDDDLPLRSCEWILREGGEETVKRPVGQGWAAEPILPRRGRTETEVSCIFHGTAVHRCLLRAIEIEIIK